MKYPGYCLICGWPTLFCVEKDNLRETVICKVCWSLNRQRQLIAVLLNRMGFTGIHARLANLPRDIRLWNLETKRTLHERLSKHLRSNYISSEYLAPSIPSGTVRDGILHVDIQNTHFADESLDVILSSDVFEHIPEPRQAIRETHRILRRGGMHVFTAPFSPDRFTTERRAVLDETGGLRHLLPPEYHSDPIRPEQGALVYNVFAPELLCDLETAGFEPELYFLHDPVRGILGDTGFVIAARKP